MRTASLLTGFAFCLLLIGCGPSASTIGNGPSLAATSPKTATVSPIRDSPTPFITTPTNSPTPTVLPSATITSTPSLTVNLEAVGDIMLARSIGQRVQASGPQIVFAGVQSALASADILVGNLECTLTTEGTPQPKGYTFAAPPETAQALAMAGFDLLDLANNHSMDFGVQGLRDTRNNLAQYQIASVGAGENAAEAHSPVILERNGLRMAFLAYADVPPEYRGFDAHAWIATSTQPGISWAYTNQINADVKAAKGQADVVIVLLHGGHESNSEVTFEQAQEAHAAIDAGAALVLGAHPHVLQPIKLYHGGLIAYSLGNFVFDEFDGKENLSAIMNVTLSPKGVQSYSWTWVVIENGLPRLATPAESPDIATLVAPLP